MAHDLRALIGVQPDRLRAVVCIASGALLVIAGACSSNSNEFDLSATPGASPRPAPSPTAAPTVEPKPLPAPTLVPGQQQPGNGMHANLPLQGEYAVTANQDDHSLSVIPIGAASVAATVQLDVAPSSVGAAPNSDTVLAADSAPSSHMLAVATLNSSAEAGTIDAGGRPDAVGTPPLSGSDAPLLVISETDNTVRPVDPTTHAVGAPLQLGAGPHAVSFARGAAMLASQQVYVANAGDGTITVLDEKATTVQTTLHTGGRPVGVVRTIDSHVWVADAASGNLKMVDPSSGGALQTISVGPQLTGLAATPDGHFLALSSSDPSHALYAVDLLSWMLGRGSDAVHSLAVDSGVLALATGAEITRAYATTGDGHLLYWDLASNTITQTIVVGRNPVGLALGLVEPSGAVAATTGGGGTVSDTAGGGGATVVGAATTTGGGTISSTTSSSTTSSSTSSIGTTPAGGTGTTGGPGASTGNTGVVNTAGQAGGGDGGGAQSTINVSPSGTTPGATGLGAPGAPGGAGGTGGTGGPGGTGGTGGTGGGIGPGPGGTAGGG